MRANFRAWNDKKLDDKNAVKSWNWSLINKWGSCSQLLIMTQSKKLHTRKNHYTLNALTSHSTQQLYSSEKNKIFVYAAVFHIFPRKKMQ